MNYQVTSAENINIEKENTITVSGFLIEKLKNFQKFLKENIDRKELHTEIDKISLLPIASIFFWIERELKPNKNNISEYVDKIYIKSDVDKSSLDVSVTNKIERYFLCFIDCIDT